MKRQILSVLLLGLVLVAAPVRATPILSGVVVNTPVLPYENYLHPVTDDDTPEWAKLPHAKAWYEISLGIQQGGIDGMLLVLRGILFMSGGNVWVTPWAELVPVASSDAGGGDTPEPANLALTGAVLAAFVLGYGSKRYRTHR